MAACAHHGATAALCAIALSLPQAAGASPLIPVDGVYGTEEGCYYHRTLDWNDAYDFFQITPEALLMPGAACNFGRFDKNTAEEISGPVICLKDPQNDIPQRQYVTHAGIFKRGAVYVVQFADGQVWGPLSKC